METFVKKLQGQLEKELSSVKITQNAVKGYDRRFEIASKGIDNLKEYVYEHPFPDQAAEVRYFKHIAPTFYSQYLYFVKLYNLELRRIASDKEGFIKYIEHEQMEITDLLSKHNDLFTYFYSGLTHLDEKYFIRNARDPRMGGLLIVIIEDFCTASYYISLMLANEWYGKHLGQELINAAAIQNTSVAKWVGTASEVVELLVSLQESGLVQIDNQPSTLIQLKERFQLFAEIDIRDINDTDYTNRQKKKQAAPFLTKLMARYLERANRLLGD